MSQRKVANPLALAVLACLAEKPMHPYEIASTLRERHKDESIKLNYGSLYSVIEALRRHGLILPVETLREGNRPERTVYRLTESGGHELNDWLAELLAEPVREYTSFEAGLSLMPVLSPGEAVALLRNRCERLEIALEQARAVSAYVAGTRLPRLLAIEAEFRLTQRQSELGWVRGLIADIESGALEGLALWRSWHEPGPGGA